MRRWCRENENLKEVLSQKSQENWRSHDRKPGRKPEFAGGSTFPGEHNQIDEKTYVKTGGGESNGEREA